MQRIILFILSGMLLLASGAKAEVIFLNCKWDNGRIEGVKTLTKGEPGTRDVNIKLDLNKKKVINGVLTIIPDEIENAFFTDNYISWNEKSFFDTKLGKRVEKLQFRSRLDLNRSSGLLKEVYYDYLDNIQITSYYYCTKENKKF